MKMSKKDLTINKIIGLVNQKKLKPIDAHYILKDYNVKLKKK